MVTLLAMQIKLWGSDFGPLVLLREALKSGEKGCFELFLNQKEDGEKGGMKEALIWQMAMELILKRETRFGRVGVFIERKNREAFDFFSGLDVDKLAYVRKSERSEKQPQLKIFSTQLLVEMVNEGLEDSVEFRRLSRRFIRGAKNAHCDTLFFADSIMGGERAKKIIQFVAGAQIKCFFVSDFFLDWLRLRSLKKADGVTEVLIYTEDDVVFVKKRAEQLLRKKLKREAVVNMAGGCRDQ